MNIIDLLIGFAIGLWIGAMAEHALMVYDLSKRKKKPNEDIR